MRLVCPNCSAQYEVDASMIPDEGRDVQCSNCGHTWFELPAPLEAAEETAPPAQPEFVEDSQPESHPEPEPEPELAAEAEAEPEVEAEPDPTPEPEPEDTPERPQTENLEEALSDDLAALKGETGNENTPTTEAPSTRELEEEEEAVFGAAKKPERRPAASNEALDILREEASQELQKRREPPSVSIETQTDMGLDHLRSKQTPSRALRARMAHLDQEEQQEAEPQKLGNWRNRFGKGKNKDQTSEAQADPDAGFADDKEGDESYREPRRDLLPDIEEINSTLTSTKTREAPPPEVIEQQQRGFRQGFVIPVALAALLIVLYTYAPAIAQRVPATEPALLKYLDLANSARDGIESLVGQ